jgi:hypothetical protein
MRCATSNGAVLLATAVATSCSAAQVATLCHLERDDHAGPDDPVLVADGPGGEGERPLADPSLPGGPATPQRSAVAGFHFVGNLLAEGFVDRAALQIGPLVAERAKRLAFRDHETQVRVEQQHEPGGNAAGQRPILLRALPELALDIDVAGDVGGQNEKPVDLAVTLVGNVGLLGVAGPAGRIDQRPVEQLRLAGQCLLHVGQIRLVDPLAQQVPDVHPTHLRRGPAEPLDVGPVRQPVAQLPIPVPDHCGQGVQSGKHLLAGQPAVDGAGVADVFSTRSHQPRPRIRS